MRGIIQKIHDAHDQYLLYVSLLENELEPYLRDFLNGGDPHIQVREDEGLGLFIVYQPVGSSVPLNYHLDEEHIDFIKKYKRINTDKVGH